MGVNKSCTHWNSEIFYNNVKGAKLSKKKKKNYINAVPCCDPASAQARRGRREQDWQYSRAGSEGVQTRVLKHTPTLLPASSL